MAEKQKGELFAGTLYLSELDPETGKYSEFFTVETDQVEINAPSERLEAISRSRENYGQAHTTYNRAQPSEITINVTESNRRFLAAKLSGKLVPLTRTAATLSGLAVTLGALDGWVEIGTEHLAATGLTVKESAAATDNLRPGVDYEINPRLGLIRPLTGGAIAANATVYLSGNAPALAGQSIQGAARYSHEFRGRLDGQNLVSGEDVLVKLPRIVVSADSAKNFLDENLATTSLTGRLNVPSDGSKPYQVDYPTLAG